MSDVDQNTFTDSSSQMETVQPFVIEESLGLEVGVESPRVLDSSTLVCSSIGHSPAVNSTTKSTNQRHYKHMAARSITNSNKSSKRKTSSDRSSSSSSSGSSRSSGSSSVADDDFATNQSAKSTESELLSNGSRNSNNKTNSNSNRPSDALREYETNEDPIPDDGGTGPGESNDGGGAGTNDDPIPDDGGTGPGESNDGGGAETNDNPISDDGGTGPGESNDGGGAETNDNPITDDGGTGPGESNDGGGAETNDNPIPDDGGTGPGESNDGGGAETTEDPVADDGGTGAGQSKQGGGAESGEETSVDPAGVSEESAESTEPLMVGANEGPSQSSTDAGATGIQTTDSATAEQSDSVFANSTDAADFPAAQQSRTSQSQKTGNKVELANLIEKAILDFCSSRTVETMRRMFAGVTNDTETQQRDGGRHDDKTASTPHPVTGELIKEGVIIGDVDVFAPRVQREYLLSVKDSLITTFIKEPGVFRAICYRTHCQVEVTRRLLNRKLCTGGKWHKYMIIRVSGPTLRNIENCDILLQRAVPSYKARKEYRVPAICRLYMREDMPDNAELYFNYQRTGGAGQRFGSLKLESPYRHTHVRTVGDCPWKTGLLRVGKLPFSNPGGKLCMSHIYPSLGYVTTNNLESQYQGVNAAERIANLYEQFQVRRQSALTLKRALTIPVCR